jgi:hypothetical protein
MASNDYELTINVKVVYEERLSWQYVENLHHKIINIPSHIACVSNAWFNFGAASESPVLAAIEWMQSNQDSKSKEIILAEYLDRLLKDLFSEYRG